MLKIATFNVNSIKARYDVLCQWLQKSNPDIVLLQELKCIDDEFKKLDFAKLDYNAFSHGQKAYNGVAILSKDSIFPLEIGLPSFQQDSQARFLSVETFGLNVASVYCPNGNPVDSPKYDYKVEWMTKLQEYVETTIFPSEKNYIIGGDYNICPTDNDVYDAIKWQGDALCLPQSRAAYRCLENKGFVNAWRYFNPKVSGHYSYWDYVKGRYYKNEGLLIDHLMLSPSLVDVLEGAGIETEPRSWEKPSDHTPVYCLLNC